MAADRDPAAPATMPRGHNPDAASKSFRQLTSNQSRVASSLFGGFLEPEEVRIRQSGLPRSSYRDAKRQLFGEGILADRYLPHPSLLPASNVSFLLSRPFAEDLGPVAQSLTQLRGSVCVWSGTQTVFAVVFHADGVAAGAFRDGVGGDSFGRPVSFLQTDTGRTDVPIFFDFEGAWNHLRGTSGTARYPRPMLGSAPIPTRFGDTERLVRLTSGLWSAPRASASGGAPPLGQGPATLPRIQRLLIRDGAVDWRVVPNLGELLELGASRIESVIFVSGTLIEGRSPATLFRDLVETCNAAPFLLASQGGRVMLASLGLGLGARPSGATPGDVRPSVRATLLRHLTQLESVREPTRAIKIHRMLDFS